MFTILGESSGNGNHLADRQFSRGPAGRDAAKGNSGVVWVLQGNLVRPVKVKVGLSDGALTEVTGAALQEGQAIVIGEKRPATAQTASANPFTPQLRRRRSANR